MIQPSQHELLKEADVLEAELRATVGLTSELDASTIGAVTGKILDVRGLNPLVFQAALIMIMGGYLAGGDPVIKTSAADIAAKLSRVIDLQKRVGELMDGLRANSLNRMLDALGIDDAEADLSNNTLPKTKVN